MMVKPYSITYLSNTSVSIVLLPYFTTLDIQLPPSPHSASSLGYFLQGILLSFVMYPPFHTFSYSVCLLLLITCFILFIHSPTSPPAMPPSTAYPFILTTPFPSSNTLLTFHTFLVPLLLIKLLIAPLLLLISPLIYGV